MGSPGQSGAGDRVVPGLSRWFGVGELWALCLFPGSLWRAKSRKSDVPHTLGFLIVAMNEACFPKLLFICWTPLLQSPKPHHCPLSLVPAPPTGLSTQALDQAPSSSHSLLGDSGQVTLVSWFPALSNGAFTPVYSAAIWRIK